MSLLHSLGLIIWQSRGRCRGWGRRLCLLMEGVANIVAMFLSLPHLNGNFFKIVFTIGELSSGTGKLSVRT